ncbi:hypothetical protein P3S67_021516 [Capsicum chacoense]
MQQEIELSRRRHAEDLAENRRLGCMLENKKIFQERVVSGREAMKQERQERINQIIQTRKQDRNIRRKLIFFLRTKEEQRKRLQEMEDSWKHQEAKAADLTAKLGAIAEEPEETRATT